MAGEAAETKLYDAARVGDVEKFQQVLQQNPHFLHVVSFPCLRNVLHIAIRQGKESLVEEVLRINPELARDVDSRNSSSLHIAAAQRSVEIAKRLLSVAPDMCYWLDDQGMNPVHVAATKGCVEILEEMLRLDSFPAMERVHRGQTVLHLCVKHRQLRALVVLAEKLGGLVRAKDDDGETILHWAVRSNQVEMIRYLVGCKNRMVLTPNSMGKTALDILMDEIPLLDKSSFAEIGRMLYTLSDESEQEYLPKVSDITMVVVVLIATMAFQAAISPPGGVWQDDTSSHKAGKAVMASVHPKIYKHFVHANTTAFVSSLVTIFLNTTKMPSRYYFLLMMATYGMWVSMASIGVSYGASLIMTNPITETQSIGRIVAIVVSLFVGILALLFLFILKKRIFTWSVQRQRENLTTDALVSRSSRRNQSSLEKMRNYNYKRILCPFSRRPGSPPSRDGDVVQVP